MNRQLSRLLYLAIAVLAIMLPISASAGRLVELDASALANGALSNWQNAGSLQGSFNAVPSGGATVATVDGRKAVTFDGSKDFLRSSFGAPASITGGKPFSVAVWVHNPKVDANEEPLVYWAHRGEDRRTAHINYGNSVASGAVVHWGGDMGFAGGVPAEAKWHLFVLTYEGGKDGLETLYVDGEPNASKKTTLNLFTGDPIYLATTDLDKFFSGSISEVQMYDYALSSTEVAGLTSQQGKAKNAPLVDLSAASLPEGKINQWPNRGTLGGSFGLQSSAPSVTTVADRKAVSFGPKSWLESSFGADFVKGPFTVEYWVCAPALVDAVSPVLSVGDQQVPEIARFSFGSNSKEGAFVAGAAKSGFSLPRPAKNAWHHIAYTYGADGALKVYVNGELDAQDKAGKLGAQSARLQLGGSWLPKRGIPLTIPQLALAKLCVYDEALSQAQIRNNGGLFDAFAPTPAHKGSTTGFSTTLKWFEGDPAIKSVDVYMGTSKADVEAATKASKAFKANVPAGKLSLGPIPIDLEQTYYWRVDEIGTDGKVKYKGVVWSFASESGKASNPKPRASVSAIPVATKSLTWKPGTYASKQTVYFSENREDVESGKAVIASGLKPGVTQCKIAKALEPGKTYYWRVANENGKHPGSKGDVWSFRTADKLVKNDVTFFVVSDLHYGTGPTVITANQATIDFMNVLPGTPYPASVGGNVATPRGVVITGDLTNDGNTDQWELFTRDYGVNGEGRVAYPVYEGFGNHDGSMAPNKVVAKGIAERNKLRKNLTAISDNGVHYSWDWDQVHMVDLNFYPGDMRVKDGKMDGPGHEPLMSLDFLKKDLAANVGKSGRPVIIMTHLGFDEGFSLGWGWWSPTEVDNFYNAIKDYNVIGVLFGHTHAAVNAKWRGIDTYNCASGQRDPDAGECMVFRVTSNELIVTQRFKDRWAEVWRKPITGIK